jgi:glycerophosphoryl diester phosphodiesterase
MLRIILHRANLHPEAATRADALELDVRCSRDGVVYIHHDPLPGKTKLRRLAYAEIVERLGQQAAPALGEYLSGIRSDAWLYLHMKEPGTVLPALREAGKWVREGRLVALSFRDSDLAVAREAYPGLPVGLLVGKLWWRHTLWQHWRDWSPQTRAHRIPADVVVCHYILWRWGTGWWLRRSHVPAVVWGAKLSTQMERCLRDPGVVGLIVDDIGTAALLRDKLTKSDTEVLNS